MENYTNFRSKYLWKCDRDKQIIFLQKERVNQIMMRHKIGTQLDQQYQKWGSSLQNLPTMPKYVNTLPPKCDRDKLIFFFVEGGGQSDRDVV